MRSWMMAAGVLALAAGFSGAYLHLKPAVEPTSPKTISADFMSLTERRPAEARSAIVDGIDTCLPDAAREGWTSGRVRNLAVESYIRFFDLMGRDIQQAERNARFSAWLVEAGDDLSAPEKAAFDRLRQGGLHDGVTLLCVAATVRGKLGDRGFRGFWN